MKRFLKILGIIILAVLLLTFLRECSLMYGNKTIESDDLRYYTHNLFRTCFAGNYTWSSDTNQAVLTIPDTCDGYRVTALGGYAGLGAPCPFSVNLSDAQYICSEEMLPDDAKIEQYHLFIHIGKNVKDDAFIVMDNYHCVGTNQFVQILVTVECSEENLVFYSQDGKLYRKSDESLVEGFFYTSDAT